MTLFEVLGFEVDEVDEIRFEGQDERSDFEVLKIYFLSLAEGGERHKM